MYSKGAANIPLFPFTKDEIIESLNPDRGEDLTKALVSIRGFVDDEAWKNAFNRVLKYSDTDINILTGEKVSEELNDFIFQVGEFGSAVIDKDGETIYNAEAERGSRLDIIIGLPASGKSTAILDTIIRISVHMNLTKNAHYPCLCA